MDQNNCPKCESELVWDGQYRCDFCEVHYTKVGFCPECSAALEKLQACGAANYFCNHCNELKSKSKIKFEFQVAESS
jgi:hypothetical protein